MSAGGHLLASPALTIEISRTSSFQIRNLTGLQARATSGASAAAAAGPSSLPLHPVPVVSSHILELQREEEEMANNRRALEIARANFAANPDSDVCMGEATDDHTVKGVVSFSSATAANEVNAESNSMPTVAAASHRPKRARSLYFTSSFPGNTGDAPLNGSSASLYLGVSSHHPFGGASVPVSGRQSVAPEGSMSSSSCGLSSPIDELLIEPHSAPGIDAWNQRRLMNADESLQRVLREAASPSPDVLSASASASPRVFASATPGPTLAEAFFEPITSATSHLSSLRAVIPPELHTQGAESPVLPGGLASAPAANGSTFGNYLHVPLTAHHRRGSTSMLEDTPDLAVPMIALGDMLTGSTSASCAHPSLTAEQQDVEEDDAAEAESYVHPENLNAVAAPGVLPAIAGGVGDVKRISGETMVRLLNGDFQGEIDNFIVIDCRYNYEYTGGHSQSQTCYCSLWRHNNSPSVPLTFCFCHRCT
jgi:hypothetical protein